MATVCFVKENVSPSLQITIDGDTVTLQNIDGSGYTLSVRCAQEQAGAFTDFALMPGQMRGIVFTNVKKGQWHFTLQHLHKFACGRVTPCGERHEAATIEVTAT